MARRAGSSPGATSHGSTGLGANAIPPQRYYTVLSVEAPDPFGFGSASPSRPLPRFADTPGPGKYEPRPGNFRVESVRGLGPGFTSLAARRLGFARGTKNPAPSEYTPKTVDRRILTKIGPQICERGLPAPRRCSCYLDERETASTPGPGSYDMPPLVDRASTSVFKSRSERIAFPAKQKRKPRFDGRTFILQRSEL
jgi:hypothetical protein